MLTNDELEHVIDEADFIANRYTDADAGYKQSVMGAILPYLIQRAEEVKFQQSDAGQSLMELVKTHPARHTPVTPDTPLQPTLPQFEPSITPDALGDIFVVCFGAEAICARLTLLSAQAFIERRVHPYRAPDAKWISVQAHGEAWQYEGTRYNVQRISIAR